MRTFVSLLVFLLTMGLHASFAQECSGGPGAPAAIKAFVGAGFGAPAAKAPPETRQFGRLVGLWRVETEMARQGGGWAKTAPGLWAWKYTLDGFAVSDLWFQSADNLPVYMADLGRDYVLTANRIYDVANKRWQVSWMGNGAGTVMGADVGAFTARLEGEDVVMRSEGAGAAGIQRVVFSDFTDDSFRWRSEYSTDDGKTWTTIMRMQAKRIDS